MARANEIDRAREEFRREITSSIRLVKDMSEILDPRSSLAPGREYIEKIAEVAFLKLVIGWEAFLERTIVLYLIGKKAGNGHCPVRLAANIQDEERAYKLLSGKFDFDIKSKYIDFLLDAERVMKFVDFFFKKHRYKSVKEHTNFISHIRNIRNHIAHNSQNSRSNFGKATRHFMKRNRSYNGTVGRFLLSKVRKNSGMKIDSEGWTYFDAFSAFFISLALEIAPEKNK